MKRNLCTPCAMELTEKRSVQLISRGKDEKITCEKCRCRRFGGTYEVRWKTSQNKNERKFKLS